MAETVTMTLDSISDKHSVLKIAWEAHTDGSLTAVATDSNITAEIKGWSIILGITDPGTAPTAAYDVSLTDAYGMDVFGLELYNRSATATEQAVPLMDAIYGARLVDTALTFDILGNSNNGATGDVYIYLTR